MITKCMKIIAARDTMNSLQTVDIRIQIGTVANMTSMKNMTDEMNDVETIAKVQEVLASHQDRPVSITMETRSIAVNQKVWIEVQAPMKKKWAVKRMEMALEETQEMDVTGRDGKDQWQVERAMKALAVTKGLLCLEV